MEKNKKVVCGVVIVIVVTLFALMYAFWPKTTETEQEPTPPVIEQPQTEDQFPDKYVFETDPEKDTIIEFHLSSGDKTRDVEWRDKTNTVVIWHSEQGQAYQVISMDIQKKWIPMPDGGELIFNNGKKLIVNFVYD